MSATWTMDGLVFTRCQPRPAAMFDPFWWVGHPLLNEHKMFGCPGEILLELETIKAWWGGLNGLRGAEN